MIYIKLILEICRHFFDNINFQLDNYEENDIEDEYPILDEDNLINILHVSKYIILGFYFIYPQ